MGNIRKALAGVLTQVLSKMGVLAGVLGLHCWRAQVRAGCFVSVFLKGPTCQHSGQHSHFVTHLCQQQHPRQHFSGIPRFGVMYQVTEIST